MSAMVIVPFFLALVSTVTAFDVQTVTALGVVGGSRTNVLGRPLEVYRGIPYAQPPMGALRFRPPEPLQGWDGVLNATNRRTACPQVIVAPVMTEGALLTEDCLHLNVWSPVAPKQAPVPVLVSIHGGGFSHGSASIPIFDGAVLAAKTGLVVVSLNYRLDILGFLDANSTEAPGNVGLMDQALALKWIQAHIHHFGGDPLRVTIFGVSAGGMSAHAHTNSENNLSPYIAEARDRPELRRAYVDFLSDRTFVCPMHFTAEGHSKRGHSVYSYVFSYHSAKSTLPAWMVMGKRLERLGLAVEEYLGIPFAKPPTGGLRFMAPEPAEPWNGTLDARSRRTACPQVFTMPLAFGGIEHTEDCLHLNVWTLQNRTEEAVPVLAWIHGGGFMEGSSAQRYYNGAVLAAKTGLVIVSFNYRLGILGFLDANTTQAPGNMGLMDQNVALKWIRDNIGRFGGDPAKVTIFGESSGDFARPLDAYLPEKKDRRSLRRGYLDYLTDSLFVCPMHLTAEEMSGKEHSVYTYVFGHRSKKSTLPAWMGTPHGWDIGYTFGMPLVDRVRFTPQDVNVSEVVITALSTFASTGAAKAAKLADSLASPPKRPESHTSRPTRRNRSEIDFCTTRKLIVFPHGFGCTI
ncbi:hypothetical protein HPB51_011541 [Rhipicephalus microplus]|uniref:Carboxylic ester hydrolase n=1 Tax=Rhipicephalus microplus TaxID=6941 RepID=A0A9J6E9H7_RHIMP|nr:hypothetical protein HPB51_011541 [Rhipicephalus microplus]